MRLLFVIKALSLPGGGAERVLADVSAALVDRGHDIIVVSYDQPGDPDFYPFHAQVKRLRLGLGDARRHAKIGETLRRMAALRRLASAENPDVAIGFMHSAYIPLGIALHGSGIPVIASEHIVYEHYRGRPGQAWLLRRATPTFAAMTAISQSVIDSYPPAVRAKMTVIPNPVKFPVRLQVGQSPGERKRLLTVGRLAAQKDHRTLIEAFARIAREFPDWDLRIVGEGELRSELESQIAGLGLNGRIQLAGSIADIEPEYSAADLFVMPSRYESFGLATAEALAHGLPAVGFADCAGTNELISHNENGLLVSSDRRPDRLAAGLKLLMANEGLRLRLGAAGPSSVQQYSVASVADAWERLLDSSGFTPQAIQ